MPEYVVPPPLPIPAGDDPFESLIPEGEAMPDDIVEVDEVIVNTGADDDAEEEEDDCVAIDDEEDRQLDHNLVGLKIRIFYNDQGKWYDGQITWFNKKMGQVRIYFEEDDTDDYIEETEINGVDVILLS